MSKSTMMVQGGVPLGSSAKSQAVIDSKGIFGGGCSGTLEVLGGGQLVDLDSGEVVSAGRQRDRGEVRLERFALQSVARSILPQSRTARCLRVRKSGAGGVDVLWHDVHQVASYGGLQTCGSVWACPVCAAKVSERRRVEVEAAVAAHQVSGGAVLLLTLTHPHGRGDRLVGLLEAETRALAYLFGSRAGKGVFSGLGRVGHIRAWEVTHGRRRQVCHGWHPHFHLLLFVEGDPGPLSGWADRLFPIWARGCVLAGLAAPSREHGVRLDGGEHAGAYVCKLGVDEGAGSSWGLGAELTKAHLKRAQDGETPADLLRSVFADRADGEGRRLFSEFAAAFHGRRQLVWSRGLRERFGLGVEATDDEVAGEQSADAALLGRLTVDEWRAVLNRDARGEVLELARHGWGVVRRFLDFRVGEHGAVEVGGEVDGIRTLAQK